MLKSKNKKRSKNNIASNGDQVLFEFVLIFYLGNSYKEQYQFGTGVSVWPQSHDFLLIISLHHLKC